tara:strand:- start:205 stop:381 length:177 start_codon:yes stop_codon:yes gene_type:complete
MNQTEERTLRILNHHINGKIDDYDSLWSRDLKNILTHEIRFMKRTKLLKVIQLLELIE